MTQNLEIPFDDESPEGRRIVAVIGGEGEERAKRLQKLAIVALEEFVLTMSGRKSVTSIRDQRELRLFLLYKHLEPVGGLSDHQVRELFQMTRSQTRTLIAGTWARYREELEKQLNDAVEAALKAGEWDDEKELLQVRLPDSLARYVRDAADETNAPPVEKVREVAGTYDLSKQTVEDLCAKLGIPAADVLPEE